MKKRILIVFKIFMVLSIVISVFPNISVFAQTNTYGNLTYTVSNSQITITGYENSPVTGVSHELCKWNNYQNNC